MVRIKLKSILEEINKYLGLPYFSNTKKIKSDNNAVVGKGSSTEIALLTIQKCQEQHINISSLTSTQIYNFEKKNKIGIDCSGLVYNILKFAQPTVDQILIGTEGKTGIRRLSADLLTSTPNSYKINWQRCQPLDLIRIDGGNHVILILSCDEKTISYVHSSQKTKIKGVHFGSIQILDSTKDLDFQKWSDLTDNNLAYANLYQPKNGDGVFRLFLFNELAIL